MKEESSFKKKVSLTADINSPTSLSGKWITNREAVTCEDNGNREITNVNRQGREREGEMETQRKGKRTRTSKGKTYRGIEGMGERARAPERMGETTKKWRHRDPGRGSGSATMRNSLEFENLILILYFVPK